MTTEKKIVSWVIEVEWEDGTFEKIANVNQSIRRLGSLKIKH